MTHVRVGKNSVLNCRVLALGLAFLIWAGVPLGALAEDKLSVVAGGEVVIVKDKPEPIEEFTATMGSVYVKMTNAGTSKRHDLVFQAPPDVPSTPVQVSYKIGNQAAKIDVTVTAVPLASTKVMFPGATSVLDESGAVPLVIDEKPKHGDATVNVRDDGKKHQLLYVAPVGVDELRDEVRYKIGTKPAKATVVVSNNPWGTAYEAAFKVLFAAFLLAVVVEWGLSVIFNWRWVVLLLDAKGLKTFVTLIVSYALVTSFDIDIVKELINALRNAGHESTFWSRVLSAFVVAGGSASVNSLMVALGFRAVRTADALVGKPLPTQAWLSVSAYLNGTDSKVKGVQVHLKKDSGNFELLTTLRGMRVRHQRWTIFRDYSRFPSYGGFVLVPGIAFTVKLQPVDGSGNPLTKQRNTAASATDPVDERIWGTYTPAAGAIIDIEDVF